MSICRVPSGPLLKLESRIMRTNTAFLCRLSSSYSLLVRPPYELFTSTHFKHRFIS